MFGDLSKLDEMVEKINNVSPSFCMAKWMHVTLHLMTGHTHSCYLPQPHKIPLDEIKKKPSALHNTFEKKIARKQMLKGKRPKECKICWDIEDLPEKTFSDRHFHSVDPWTMPHFDKVKNMKWHEDINPTYVEVSFSSTCNFKCMYCAPSVSTAWLQEIKKHGPMPLTFSDHQNLKWLERKGHMPLDEDDNPYLDAFWEWWPELVETLSHFRITGGEPLLSPSTFRVMEYLNENPKPDLDLAINSNLGIPDKVYEKYLTLMEPLLAGNKIKYHVLHTSLDAWGEQAEYIRNGLVLDDLVEKVEVFMDRLPQASLGFMCTFNILSIPSFKDFLAYILNIRRTYNKTERHVLLDIPHLQGPEFLSAKILTEDYHEQMEDLVSFMKANEHDETGFLSGEIQKMERILGWMKQSSPQAWLDKQRSDFYFFIKSHDERRKTDFLSTFPEMEEFYELCKQTSEKLRG